MVENKIIEEKEPEIEILVPESNMQELVLFPKIDLSNVKIWNRKLRRWFQIKPEELTLFPENSEKCWKCGFYRKYCQCREKFTLQQRFVKFKIKIKKRIKKWTNKLKIKYHKFRYLHFHKKHKKYFKKAGKHYLIYNELYKAQVDDNHPNLKKINTTNHSKQNL